MLVDRPDYIDIPAGRFDLVPPEFDVCEVKYDGMWVTVEIEGKRADFYSRNGNLVDVWKLEVEMRRAVLLGEYMIGTPAARASGLHGCVMLHDCLYYDFAHHGGPQDAKPLLERRQALRTAWMWLRHERIHLPKLWYTRVAAEVWESRPDTEGLVFKDSRAPYGADWGRMKRVFEMDYVNMGIENGSIKGGLNVAGVLVPVCSVPLTAKQAADPMPVFKATGTAQFKSGAMRGATFRGWHADKQPEKCKWPK